MERRDRGTLQARIRIDEEIAGGAHGDRVPARALRELPLAGAVEVDAVKLPFKRAGLARLVPDALLRFIHASDAGHFPVALGSAGGGLHVGRLQIEMPEAVE